MFILERGDDAEDRGASIRAKILGYYLNSDAYHITTPNPKGEGAQNLMKQLAATKQLQLK